MGDEPLDLLDDSLRLENTTQDPVGDCDQSHGADDQPHEIVEGKQQQDADDQPPPASPYPLYDDLRPIT